MKKRCKNIIVVADNSRSRISQSSTLLH